jgi:hypothetical protein
MNKPKQMNTTEKKRMEVALLLSGFLGAGKTTAGLKAHSAVE